MSTVLVSGASGVVGYGVLRALRRASPSLRLIGTTIYDDSVAPAFCDVFEQAVPTGNPDYLPWLTRTVAKHRVDLLIPGIEADVYEWAGHVPEIESAGARPLLNNLDLILACKDKWTFYEHLQEFDTPYAIDTSLESNFDELRKAFGLPFLLKPRRGYGSKGIVEVADRAVFERYRANIGPILMAQRIVGSADEEYTTSAFGDGRGGSFASMTLKRKLSSDGYTEKAEVVESADVIEAVTVLCRCFAPIGPTNFQFRKHEGTLKLLEINPRVSSSTSIRAAFGYNESDMAVQYFLNNKEPSQPAIRRGRAVRYVEEVIFFEDPLKTPTDHPY
jgi:carbamoyl-phosphate synthase large subunit